MGLIFIRVPLKLLFSLPYISLVIDLGLFSHIVFVMALRLEFDSARAWGKRPMEPETKTEPTHMQKGR